MKSFLIVSFLTVVSSCSEEETDSLSINDTEGRRLPGDIECFQNCPGDDDDSGGGGDYDLSFERGYNEGLEEGERLALIPNLNQYTARWMSYRDYPGNFPNETQNHEFFRGKYLGIVDGWLANYDPGTAPGGGWDLPDGITCADYLPSGEPCGLDK